ncbi:hypothetical protein [Streptomyces sp. MNU103]|uniref:hypothetical protein n=1 Tax=Streptomyces sp. MNU103 TaxID=2560024 RepID=UPI001E3D5907|nr:hypothetical protein [Streptomyces sp. MNU103]
MTRLVLGTSLVALSLAALVFLVWWWLAGTGRHRAPRPAAGGAGALEGAPAVLTGAGRADTDTLALQAADRADFAHCPAEQRRTAHFLHADGSRTCCGCSTTTSREEAARD